MSDTVRLPARWSRTLVLLGACACWAAPAQAWTRANVEHVEAELRVDAGAQAEVVMLLGVRVQGGWLSRFEVTGLDADFALDAQRPPTLTAEDGSTYVPRVETHADGRLELVFEGRRAAPHRGRHQVRLAYTTQLKANGKHVTWSLPPWGVDLEDVRVRVDVPAGTTLGAQSEDDVAVQRERIERDGRTLLSYRRAQLPRTLPLSVEFDLLHEVAPRERVSAAPAAARKPLERPSAAALWAGACVLALCWLKRRAVRAMCSRYRLRPLPLLGLHPALRACAMLALTLAFCFAYEEHVALALPALAAVVALAFDRGFARAPRLRTAAGYTRAVAPSRLQDWFGHAAWLDATTPLGFGLLGSAIALAALRLSWNGRPGLWLETLLLVTPLWLTGTRLHLPRKRQAPQPMANAVPIVVQGAESTRPEPVRRAAAARPAPGRAA